MKLLLFTLSLCLATLISGCQSWSTVILAVDGADVPAITVDRVEARCREAMSAASPNAQVTRTTSRGLLPVERI